MKKTATLLAFAAFSTAATQAMVVYTTDFTAPTFSDNTAINGIDGWDAQGGISTTDTSGAGEVVTNLNFNRAIQAEVAFAVGSTVTITADVRSIGGNNPSFDANILALGLTTNRNLGTTGAAIGALLGGNGTMFRFSNSGAGTADRVDAGTIDTTVRPLVTSITKTSTANEFSVTNSFNGVTQTYTATDATLYAATNITPVFQYQGQTNVGGVGIQGFEVDVTAVPEPSSALLLGLGGLMAFRRRR